MFTFIKKLFKTPTIDRQVIIDTNAHWEYQNTLSNFEHKASIYFNDDCSEEVRKSLAELISLYKDQIVIVETFTVGGISKKEAEVIINSNTHTPYKKEYFV
jgi:hypothetical protein